MNFFLEVLIGGLLSGVMYALVALGFVMIYKASGVFNFAQGAMVYLAALSVVGVMEWGAPLWLAIIMAFVMLISMGRFSRLWFNSMSWLFEGLIVSPLMFLLGSSVQEYQFSYLLFFQTFLILLFLLLDL